MKVFLILGVDCGNPGEINNGTVTFVNTFVGSLVSYRCNDGFKLVGDSLHICSIDGSWTGVVPLCQRE